MDAACHKKCRTTWFKSCIAEAVRLYDQAIAGAPKDATLLGNRSAAYLAMGLYQEAAADAQRSIALDGAWPKGHYRQGTAHPEAERDEPITCCRRICLKYDRQHALKVRPAQQTGLRTDGARGVDCSGRSICSWPGSGTRQQGHGEPVQLLRQATTPICAVTAAICNHNSVATPQSANLKEARRQEAEEAAARRAQQGMARRDLAVGLPMPLAHSVVTLCSACHTAWLGQPGALARACNQTRASIGITSGLTISSSEVACSMQVKLRGARRQDARLAALNQVKQSMAAPDWELDDFEWCASCVKRMAQWPAVYISLTHTSINSSGSELTWQM